MRCLKLAFKSISAALELALRHQPIINGPPRARSELFWAISGACWELLRIFFGNVSWVPIDLSRQPCDAYVSQDCHKKLRIGFSMASRWPEESCTTLDDIKMASCWPLKNIERLQDCVKSSRPLKVTRKRNVTLVTTTGQIPRSLNMNGVAL